MGYRGLLGDPVVRRFVELSGGFEALRRGEGAYTSLKALAFFCRVSGLGPGELVEALKNGREDLWELFFGELRRTGRTGITANRYLAGLRAFLRYVRVREIDWEYVNEVKRRVYGRGLTRNLFAEREGELTKDLIRTILIEACRNYRDRVLVLFLATTGMSFGDLLKRRVGDIQDLWEEKDLYRIDYVRSKTGVKVTTFTTREARDILIKYLEQRKSKGEQIGPRSPLIARIGAKPMKRTRAVVIIRRIFERCGLNEVIGRDARGRKRYKYHAHLFRKYFRTALRNAGVDRIYAEALMGHDIRSMFGVEMVYDKQADDPYVLEEQYRKALGELTFLTFGGEQGEGKRLELLEELMERLEKLEAKMRLIEMQTGKKKR